MNSKVKMISEMKKTSFIAMPDPSLHSLSCACVLSIWNIALLVEK